ncbi:MAG: LysE family transporter [Syntrophaceae bacterium]|nr:LysE family transporter [Syntrophaceae bacterium]
MLTNLLTIFASSFIIAFSGAMMPGPLLTITISESPRRGFITGPLLIAGHAVLELALITALLLGLAPFFQMPFVFVVTAITGSLILMWMAINMLRSLPSLNISWEEDQTAKNHPIISGILMSVANPYWIIWWATIGLGYILYSWQFGLWGIIFFFAGHILADLSWYSFISAAVARGKHFLNDRLYRGLMAGCAVFLILFACYFAYAGLEKLLKYFI